MTTRIVMIWVFLAICFQSGFGAMVNNPADYPPIQADSLKEFVTAEGTTPSSQPYACEDDLIEVMFAQDSKVRLRKGAMVDLATNALAGVDDVLQKLAWFEWYRICDVPEERLDEIQSRGEANTSKPVYNLNNIYRLRIPKGLDVWAVSKKLEALPGIILARPVPKPIPPPFTPPNYVPQQGYLDPASSTPTGIDAEYAWAQPGGNGAGVTVCDLEGGWKYNHADISKALGSQINSNVDEVNEDHGTAVIGILVSDNNGWGTTGICYGASLKTCGTCFPTWNVPGAMAVAIANLSAGDVILLEEQWDYVPYYDYFIPIEWWTSISPDPQTFNAVYASIVNAVSNGIHVVEAGGNGYFNTDALTWYGNSGAIIVGAGGAYSGDLQKLSFSSYGSRFDLQGWGENVVTTGYGNLYSAEGENYWYINTFSGTSSASAIVAGVVACYMGYWKANISATPPSPAYLRTALVNTGTPQVTPPYGNIGPRPDLQAAFLSLSPQESTLVRVSGTDPVYWLQNGKLYWVTTADVINQMSPLPGWGIDQITDYPPEVFDPNNYPHGPRFITPNADSSNGLLIKQQGADPVYLVWNGQKRWIRSGEALQWNGKDWWPDVIEVTASIASMFSSGYDLYAIGQDAPSGAKQSIIDAYHLNEDNTSSGYPGPYCSYLLFATSPVHVAAQSGCSGITGKYQRFEYSDNTYGAINWTNEYGAWEFHGAIGQRYKDLGFSSDLLGFPTSDEYQWGSYRRSNFECGYIYWDPSTDLTYVVYTDDVREIDEGESPPSDFVLFQNYPNPFNPTTNIEFLLPHSGQVKIEIYNISGQKVRTLVDQFLKAGHKLVDWDGKDDNGNDVSSGIYFYRLQAGDFSETKKMVLLR